MNSAPYTHILTCLDRRRQPKYRLPALFSKESVDYWWYDRPHPLVHHDRKNQTFVLPYPEIILVSKKACHCISIGFDRGVAVNMYININLLPEVCEQGHQWIDLELDLQRTKQKGDVWITTLLDEDEFLASDLSEEDRSIARREVELILQRIENRVFPFDLRFVEQSF